MVDDLRAPTAAASAGEALAAALAAPLAALRSEGAAALPPVRGLQPVQVLRAMYRRALDARPLGPLLHLHTKHLSEGLPSATVAQAAGGWIFLEGEGAEALQRARLEEARALGVSLLWPEEGPELPLAPEHAAALLHLDGLHGVAVDPALAGARRALLTLCRSLGPARVLGEPGTGKTSLVRWAHATLDDRPLSWLRGGQGQHRPGEWALVEEPAELDADQREALARLVAEDAPAPPPRWAAPLRRPRHPALRAILGESAALAEVLHELVRVAPTGLPVLVTGEPGTGKESLASAVHALSGRTGPLVAVDVGALSEDLAESELFGHKRGAFTGADRARPGAFRAAHGGTLFLDELGNLPARLQVKLLRVLQERVVLPVGEDAPVSVDVRLVAATNADLGAMVRRGVFRADLLSRLDAVTLRLPPLRERVEDLDPLAAGLLGADRPDPWCTPEARQILSGHRWPGNVRELGNVLRYAAAVCPPGQPIAPEHLGPLSPRNRRRVPVLVVSASDSTEGWGLDGWQIRSLTLSTLAVPALRERGDASIRGALLSGLDRPVEPLALDLLARLPWWGNLPELRAFFTSVRALPPGPLDRASLVGLLPHLMDLAAEAPMIVALLPSLDEEGRLTGLIREVHAGAALLGRARSLKDLSGPDPRSAAAMAAIRSIVRGAPVSAVDLSLIPRLSRASALIQRSEAGLEVHALPSATVRAGPLGSGEPRVVTPGAPVALGSAGEISIYSRAGERLVQVFVFLGQVALAEAGPAAVARAAVGGEALDATQDARPPPEVREAATSRVWTLTAEERAALTELVVGYEGGQLKAHVQAAVEGWSGRAGLRRLSRYLEEAPRLSQYLSRLVEHEENGALREDLAAALLGLPDAEARLSLLPRGVRDAVMQAG